MDLANEWFPNINLRKFDTTFGKYYTYENKLMSEFQLSENAIHKA